MPTSEAIVELYHAGELAAEFAKFHETPDDTKDSFVALCVSLHNSQKIDLTAIPSQPQFAAIAGHNFFIAQHFYCEAIPSLKTDALSLMKCCRALVERGGADLAASEPNGAFRKWCANNLDEAASIISNAKAGDALAMRFATFALQASEDHSQAIGFITNFKDERRLFGITALARMNLEDADGKQQAVNTLEPLVASTESDDVRSHALHAAFELFKKTHDKDSASKLATVACLEPGPSTLHCLTHLVWLHHELLSDEAFEVVAVALEGVSPEHLGTIRDLDVALYHLLGTPREWIALRLLTAHLADGKLTLDNFKSTTAELKRTDSKRLYELIAGWLVAAEQAVCKNVVRLIRFGEKQHFDANVASLGLSAAEQAFLCRKAIGFLFTSPVVCCSILVSVLRGGTEVAKSEVAELLFDPFLVNYSGEAVDYLKEIGPNDPAYDHVQKALKRHEDYFAGVKAAGEIKELHPSDYQRDIVSQGTHDKMHSAQKRAEDESVLLSLVHRSTLLYGKRSLTYVVDDDGSSRTVAMDLNSIGFSFEIPRQDILDPVGLDLMLRVFRAEKMP